MMSVPAINPVLPPSGSQPPKVSSGPPGGSVSPIGLSVQPNKISVVPPPQITTSPSKSGNLSVNHSAIPLSLVHENKVSGPQVQQPPLAKSPAEKSKEPSPAKPTSNGVEAAVTKSPSPAQPAQASAPAPAPPPASASASSPGPAVNKTEENAVKSLFTNHSEEVKSSPPSDAIQPAKEEPAQNLQIQSQTGSTAATGTITATSNASPKAEQAKSSVNVQTPSKEPEAASEVKINNEAELPSNAESAGSEIKPTKPEAKTPQANKRKREQKTEEQSKDDSAEPEKKPRRIRSQVLPYQSPLPELATFINKTLKEKDANQKNNDEKLTVFYKNEFLAVRNAEGGFYLCQTLQNVYRSSHRIRIRWLSQEKESESNDGDIYTPDFYDYTDFECILTTVALDKLDKNKYKLPKLELERTENILKRALDVEKGVSEKPSLTEEHPDGLDLSLYKDEAQLQQPKKGVKRKSSSPAKKSPKQAKKSVRKEEPTPVVTKKKSKSKTRSRTPKKSTKTSDKGKATKKASGRNDGSRDKQGKSIADQLKVSPPNEKARVVAKVLRKIDITPVQEISSKKAAKTKGGKKSTTLSKKTDKKSSKKTEKASVPSTSSTRSSERRASGVTSRKKGNTK